MTASDSRSRATASSAAASGLDVGTTRPILVAAFLRAVATGIAGVLLGLHVDLLFRDEGPVAVKDTIGLLSSLGLWGTVLAAAVATWHAERIGRRRTLLLVALLSVVGGVLFALGSGKFLLGAAALVGMVNAMGRDRGAALICEQSLLADSVEPKRRTFLFARYNVAQDVGHAVGALCAGLPAWLQRFAGTSEVPAMRAGMASPVLLFVLAGVAAAAIPARVDASRGRRRAARLSPSVRPIVTKISSLFFLDSFGGGILTTTLIAYWFKERFHVDVGENALLTAGARVLNALSHFGAAWLAKRVGLVNTMVFTHLPSSLMLVAAAYAPTFPIAAALYLLREGLGEMDVPTRQSYVLAIVPPDDRTTVAGLTTLVRMAAWAIGPLVGGYAMGHLGLATPLLIGSAIKIAYDLLLWRACRRVRPPEEQAS